MKMKRRRHLVGGIFTAPHPAKPSIEYNTHEVTNRVERVYSTSKEKRGELRAVAGLADQATSFPRVCKSSVAPMPLWIVGRDLL